MAKKKKSDNEIIDEVIAQSTPVLDVENLPEEVIEEIVAAPVIEEAPAPVAEDRRLGMYYHGKWVSAVPAKLGQKWTIIVEGKRLKVNRAEIEIVRRK